MGDVRMSDQMAEIAQTAVVQPGDTLIIRVAPNTSRDVLERMVAVAKQAIPDVELLIVGAEEMAVYRPEAGE
jgi:hypothetical protein